jgi:hypothetical protein
MTCYKSSIEALQQLLHLGTPDGKISDKSKSNSNVVHCQITKTSKDVSYMKNGMEYFFVEVTCSDGTQYGLQAYGEEANELYKESYRCIMRGNAPREPKKSKLPKDKVVMCIDPCSALSYPYFFKIQVKFVDNQNVSQKSEECGAFIWFPYFLINFFELRRYKRMQIGQRF